MKNEEYTCKHFSISLPQGSGQANVPNLLRHLAETLEKDTPNADVLDIVFRDEIDLSGQSIPSFTVYYSDEDAN